MLHRVTDRFERNTISAHSTARVQLDMILANADKVRKVRGGEEKLKAAMEFDSLMKHRQSLTPGQLSYIDAIYEAMWKGAGYESINTHHDKPTTLRHPK